MSFIELNQISFSYPGSKETVLSDFSLTIEQGQAFLIEGDNGAGKTTLFRILNGLSFPQKGRYLFDGTEISESYLKENTHAKLFHKRIGFLFQNPDVMLFNGNVYDEIAFGPRQMGLSDTETKKRVEDCMALLHIEDLADKAPYHLSGGQKKRVALAAVLSLNPEVLVLDEPFAGLDKKTQNWMLSLFQELKAGEKTLIFSSHEDLLRENLADFIINMSEEVPN